MIIHELRSKKDLEEIRLDSAVDVAAQTFVDDFGGLALPGLGLLYEITEKGFSVIQNIPGERHPELGRVNYTFSNDGAKVYRGDTDFPLHPETQEYIIYQENLRRVGEQLAREQRRAQNISRTSRSRPTICCRGIYTGPIPPRMPICIAGTVLEGFNE